MEFSTMADWILDALLDTAKLLPFLFLCYLLLEWIERRVDFSRGRVGRALQSPFLGPLVGGVCGVVPQCGFSAVAAGLYAGRVVTAGTLVAVFLSTSDEMLPILLSNADRIPPLFIPLLLLLKVGIAVLGGYLFNLLFFRRRRSGAEEESDVHEMCEQDGCHCEGHGLFYAALYHTLRIALFLLAVTLCLNVAIGLVGEDRMAAFLLDRPLLGNLLAAGIGLIPNCASSVVLTELYLGGALSFGAMLSGLLPGAGVGLLVLFRINRHPKENLLILAFLFAVGVLSGYAADALGVDAFLRGLAA